MFSALSLAAERGPMVGAFLGGFGWLFLLIPLFWLALAVVVVVLVARRWRRGPWGHGGPAAHDAPWAANATRGAESTLGERFAQGDIDEKEYRARLEVLRASRPDVGVPR